ncbi:hypothetical protein JXO52_16850 [bacterium]|nr:hypothetical protein [bacterium]
MLHDKRILAAAAARLGRTCALLLFAMMSLGSDCDESLPAYEEPENALQLDLYTSAPEPMRLRYDKIRIMGGVAALSFDLDLSNQFDETISGAMPARIGRLDISWDDDSEVIASLDITHEDEKGTNYFNPLHPVMLDPGDTASFLVIWRSFQDNRGTYLWQYAGMGEDTEDDLHIYHNHLPMQFTVTAHMQPVEGGPVVYAREYPIVITFYDFEMKQ